MQVLVRDNNIDQALRVLKKKLQREGLFREDEGQARLRETVGEACKAKGRGHTPLKEACPQAGTTRRSAAGAEAQATRRQGASAGCMKPDLVNEHAEAEMQGE